MTRPIIRPHDGISPLARPGRDPDRGLYLCDLARRSDRWALLSNAERERAARFKVPGARDRFVAARGALRLVVAEWLDVTPAGLELRTTATGKPYIPGAGLAFSLSHSGDRAAIACSRRGRVGVDIEEWADRPDWRELLRRISSDAEWDELERRGLVSYEELLRRWTAKEAIAKADGRGLAIELETIVLARDAGGTLHVQELGFEIEEHSPAGYVLSTAWETNGRRNLPAP